MTNRSTKGKWGKVAVPTTYLLWMDKLVNAGIRLSRAEIVREGLNSIKFTLDHALNEWDRAKEIVKEIREE